MANAPQYRRLRTSIERQPSRDKSASERGYDHHWSTVTRPEALDYYGRVCRMCFEEGGVFQAMATLAKVGDEGLIVDHVIPAHVIPRSKFHDMNNLQLLCRKHHGDKSAEDAKRYGVARR